jgi:hypothetical protein
MASSPSAKPLVTLQKRPLRGAALGAEVLVVWIAGALYCSGYEALSTGIDNWPGSLVWSAVAILPWLALFEWSKTHYGRQLLSSLPRIAVALVMTGAASLALGRVIGAADGHSTPLLLSILRRLPAAGTCLLLMLWSRAGQTGKPAERDMSLSALAPSLDWVEAADNYIELHIGRRIIMRRMALRDAETALSREGFVRIHRRFLVKASRIAAVHGNGVGQIVRLTTGVELPVGRSFAPNLPPTA